MVPLLLSCSDKEALSGVVADAAIVQTADSQPSFSDLKSSADGPQDQSDSRSPPPLPSCNPSLSLQPLVLAQDYCVAYRVPLPAAKTISALAVDGASFWVFASDGAPTWGQVLAGTVSDLDPPPVLLEEVFSFAPISTDKVFPSTYLARSPQGALAVGYTYGDVLDGEIVWSSTAGQPLRTVKHTTGNYDVLFWDESTLLVNGLGVEGEQQGQGIYLWQAGQPPRLLIKDVGMLSGYLALGPQVLFAGGYFSTGNQVFAFTRHELQQAISQHQTLSGETDGDLVFIGQLLDATALDNDLVVLGADESWSFTSVLRITTTQQGQSIIPQDVQEVITAGGTAQVAHLSEQPQLSGQPQQLGLQLEDGSQTELALIVSK